MSDLLALHRIAENNGDVKCSTTIDGVQEVKQGSKLTIWIDKPTGQQLMRGYAANDPTHVAVLYVVNLKQYREAKEQVKKQKEALYGPELRTYFEEFLKTTADPTAGNFLNFLLHKNKP